VTITKYVGDNVKGKAKIQSMAHMSDRPVKFDPSNPEEIESMVDPHYFSKMKAKIDAKAGPMLKESVELDEAKISTKDPATMTAGQVNKEMKRLEDLSYGLTKELIAAGRGSERILTTLELKDPLSLRVRAVSDRKEALMSEIKARTGKWGSSLPTQGRVKYGPRTKR
jgi:hypothetical protein